MKCLERGTRYRYVSYPGKATRFSGEGAQCLNTSSEKPAQSIPGVAKRTHGPGACIRDLSKSLTAECRGSSYYKASRVAESYHLY